MPSSNRFAAAVLFVVASVTSGHALTPAERSCQIAVARAGRQIFERSMTILASCHRSVAGGALPPGTDCLTDPETAARRAETAAAATQRVLGSCTDGTLAALTLAGDCAGADTVAEAVACLQASHGAEAEALMAVADPTRIALGPDARSCEAQASRQARRFAGRRLRLIQRCKNRPQLRDQLPFGTSCSAEPGIAQRIGAAYDAAAAKIAARCDAAAVAEAPFGAPCDAAATGADLAACVLAVANETGDGALAAEYADRAFCGDAIDEVDRQVDAVLAQMTLEEKVGQMAGNGMGPTGNWHTPRNIRLGIPGFRMTDGPRGVGALTGNSTAFPVGIARGATWDPALEERVGDAIGEEARAKTANVLLAPTINVVRHPRWGRTQESYGEDTVHVGRMGVGFIRGAQHHLIANAKHYAANSIENTRFNVDVSVDERSLREVYLPHFLDAVDDGDVGSVMTAYNKVNTQYCAENFHLLRDVLKGDWAFQGFVISDWIFGVHSTAPSANAGLDIEMPGAFYFGPALVTAVNNSDVAMSVIDDAVRRILRAKRCFHLDNDPPPANPALVESPEHLDLALEVAQKSIVLLKNDAAALPVDRSQVTSIVVVGDLATLANLGDNGSSDVTPSTAVSPLDGILARAGSVAVTHIAGPPLSPGDQAAVAAADAAVVVAGLTFADEGEGFVAAGDRVSLDLPGGQDQLVADVAALNARTIVVLEGSGPVTMPWLPDVAAVMTAWYPGQQGGYAIGDVLFGDVNPSGRLPATFPVAEADLPPFDNVSLAVTYDYLHGYRWMDDLGIDPLFPFGFGLSYTTFAYSNLTLSRTTLAPDGRLRVTADVTNTGGVAGDEVVQLYVGYQGSGVSRAVRDLKGFARVHLEPGETRTVPLVLRAADLAF
jgi:beta-glucosidase